MLGRPTRITQSYQRRSRTASRTSSQKGIPKGAAACERRPLWRASLVTFLHEQESDTASLSRRSAINPAAAGGKSLCQQQPSPPPQAATPSPATRSVAPLTAGGIRNASKGCFFSCKKHPSCRCAAIHPPKIRFYGKRVPLTAVSGQRRCLWNPQPLKRLAKLLHKPVAAGGNPKPPPRCARQKPVPAGEQ